MSSARKKKGSSSGSGSSSSSSSSKKETTQPSLRQCVQKRLSKDVFEAATSKHSGWNILIVDEPSMKVISAAVGMYDIMERRVTIVESLEKKRAPFPDMGAIYILSPTEESVNRLLDDYSQSSKVLYGQNVFLYFLSHLPAKLLEKIKSCKQLVKRLKAFSEINIDFLAKEERSFVLDMRDSFASFYLRNGPKPEELAIAEKLVTVCATLNEYPYIRYRENSGICSSLASLFHVKMDEFVKANATWWYHGSGKSENKSKERERSTLLILDRASDCLTPIMHDFTYQSMVRDLLEMQGDKITYQAESPQDPDKKENKDVLLNENDKLWVELRGKHIAQVIELLSERIQEVVNSSTGSALNKKKSDGNTMSMSEMASALKALPEYQELMSKLSQHMHLSHQCMDKFNSKGLLELSEVEQTLATGKDEDGDTPALSDMIEKVATLLERIPDAKTKLRLILIATISQKGLTSADRDRLLGAANLSRDELQTLGNLEQMGVSTHATPTKGGLFGKTRIQSSGSIDEDSEYANSRYVPNLKLILEDLVGGSLSIEEYPSVVPMPETGSSSGSAMSARRRGKAEGSARKKKGSMSKWKATGAVSKPTSSAVNFTGGRNLVFMVGGLSYSEMKAVRDVMEKESREIIIGSTTFISPEEFMDDLKKLTPP